MILKMPDLKETSEFIFQNMKNIKTKRFLLVNTIIIALIASYSIYFDSLMWTLSALGRIALIKILPYWDWTHLYTAKCLISKQPTQNGFQLNANQFKDCHLCEKLEFFNIVENITFLQLRDQFIYKAKPVLIKNSSEKITISELIQNLYDTNAFLYSSPCDVETNLMQYKYFNVEEALSYIENEFNGSWFLQLRNCEFSAVKSSRKFLTKPRFYAEHLEPFYSSWLLLSNNYAGLEKRIKLNGLIILQQLQGDLIISLAADLGCMRKCKEQNVVIKSGESIVFSTDLWSMSYIVDVNQMSLTSIMEIYF